MRITVNERFLLLKRVTYSREPHGMYGGSHEKKRTYAYICKILYMETCASSQSGITGTRFTLMTKTRGKYNIYKTTVWDWILSNKNSGGP